MKFAHKYKVLLTVCIENENWTIFISSSEVLFYAVVEFLEVFMESLLLYLGKDDFVYKISHRF